MINFKELGEKYDATVRLSIEKTYLVVLLLDVFSDVITEFLIDYEILKEMTNGDFETFVNMELDKCDYIFDEESKEIKEKDYGVL